MCATSHKMKTLNLLLKFGTEFQGGGRRALHQVQGPPSVGSCSPGRPWSWGSNGTANIYVQGNDCSKLANKIITLDTLSVSSNRNIPLASTALCALLSL